MSQARSMTDRLCAFSDPLSRSSSLSRWWIDRSQPRAERRSDWWLAARWPQMDPGLLGDRDERNQTPR